MMENLITQYIEAYNNKDVSGMLELVDDQVIFENISNSSGTTKTTSKNEFQQLALQSLAYFSERKQSIRFAIFGEESASVEIDYKAIVAQDFPNGLKAGQQLELRGVSIFEAKEGKISRISDYS